MEAITSKENKLVKKLIKLKDKKHRKEFNEFIAEGERWIGDALKQGKKENIIGVILNESKSENVPALTLEYPFLNGKITVLSDELFSKVTQTETSPGIMVLHKCLEPQSTFPSGKRCLYLDRVRDPGNLGMILRSAAACGFSEVVLCDCADEYNSKTIRACMTGILYLNIYHDLAVPQLKEKGYKIIAADMGGENVFNFSLNAEKVCLIIGNEANGIDQNILAQSDSVISLPMKDVESLNAGAAATTIMYLLTNKN